MTTAHEQTVQKGWYGNGCDQELLRFAKVMRMMLLIDEAGVWYLLEKPWKYTPEYDLWVEYGRPEENGVALSQWYGQVTLGWRAV